MMKNRPAEFLPRQKIQPLPTRKDLDGLSNEVERLQSMKQFIQALYIALSGEREDIPNADKLHTYFQRNQRGKETKNGLYAIYMVLPHDEHMDPQAFEAYVTKKRLEWCDEFIDDMLEEGKVKEAYEEVRKRIYKDAVMNVDLGLVYKKLDDDGTLTLTMHEDVDVQRDPSMRTNESTVTITRDWNARNTNGLLSDCFTAHKQGLHPSGALIYLPRP